MPAPRAVASVSQMRFRTLALFAIHSAVAILVATACTAEADRRVYDSPAAVEPLAPGQRVPQAPVLRLEGESVDLAELVRERGALLVFYRGHW